MLLMLRFVDTPNRGPNRLEDTIAFIEEVVKDTNVLIEACNLGSQGELGYSINRDYWGFGFATEATKAMINLGFKDLKLHRIYATCRPNNVGSYRVLEKIGMRREGHLRVDRFFKGKWHDSFLYAILRSEVKNE
ncbi:GNAT family N-acetyltransferase [Paenibacillus qinlingensis]|uniref:GNAT family N-acetyltransferase n=1 Tax=Paenibacillus qinlingensis TaxID=1837343 RepID=UPI001FE2561F|nr:GNAT family protein [Paenibacillus qinlingensis]